MPPGARPAPTPLVVSGLEVQNLQESSGRGACSCLHGHSGAQLYFQPIIRSSKPTPTQKTHWHFTCCPNVGWRGCSWLLFYLNYCRALEAARLTELKSRGCFVSLIL